MSFPLRPVLKWTLSGRFDIGLFRRQAIHIWMNNPDWTLYRSFLSVAEEGSLSAAARALGLSQPTLGRHVAELEASLATELFTRGDRKSVV